jgi:DNA-binding MarR family transcriptional regulator
MSDEHQQSCDDLFALLHRAKAASAKVAEALGMTHIQVFVLYAIGQRGSVPMGRLAQVLHCDASNITGIIDRLVVQQLVKRQESSEDRRTKTLTLTPKGQQVLEALTAALPKAFGYDTLTTTEQQLLHSLIQKLTA